MKASYKKLQEYFNDTLPEPNKVAELLTFHSYEVEGVEEKDGDYIFSIDVLPNRQADSFDEEGVARELSAILDIPLSRLSNGVTKSGAPKWKEGDLKISVSVEEINKLLGSDISVREVENIFKRLDFEYEIKGDEFVVMVPSNRTDLKVKADIIEEVGRIYGYENIKAMLPDKPEEAPKVNKKFYYTNKIKNFLVNEGFSEVYTYSFRSEGEVEIIKPFASDKNFLRTDLKKGLSDALYKNIRNRPLLSINEIRIFEIGNVFSKNEEHMSFAIGWSGKDESTIDKLSEFLGVSKMDFNFTTYEKDTFAEVNFDELLDKLPEPVGEYEKLEKKEAVTYKPISPYPFVLRDIAVWVPKDKTSDDIFNIVEKEAGELLVSVRFFDEFEKDNKVSYAFNLVFQSQEKTLSDEEVNKVMDIITKALNTNTDWQVR